MSRWQNKEVVSKDIVAPLASGRLQTRCGLAFDGISGGSLNGAWALERAVERALESGLVMLRWLLLYLV